MILTLTQSTKLAPVAITDVKKELFPSDFLISLKVAIIIICNNPAPTN